MNANSAVTGSGPLTGVTVLDLSRMYPGAFCTLMLADLGAEVIKVEAPGFGDGMRALAFGTDFNAAHTALNRGKRSIVLDLRSDEGADALKQLAATADVVVESHRPGALDRSGIGYDGLSAINPRLVWCSITGFGTDGPNAHAPGHDITYLGYSGLLARLGESVPTPPGVGVSLPVAGLTAALGITSALHERATTGVGRRIDTNMVDSAMWMLSEEFARAAHRPMPGWGSMAARAVYRCADGRFVTVASNEPKTWAALCDALDVPDLAGHQIGVDDEAPVIARLADVFATKPAAEWSTNPGLDGGVGPVNEAADLLDDPQIAERGGMASLDDGTPVLASPIRFDLADGRASTLATAPPPELGADTDDILGRLEH